MVKKFASLVLSAALVLVVGCEQDGEDAEMGGEPTGDVTYTELEEAEPVIEPEPSAGVVEPVEADTADTEESSETVVGDATLEELVPESTGQQSAAENADAPSASAADTVEEVPANPNE